MYLALKLLVNRYLGEKGQGVVEYAVILAFVVVIATALGMGTSGTLKTQVASVLTNVTSLLAGSK